MRLLGRFKIESETVKGSYNLFFVKKDRLFLDFYSVYLDGIKHSANLIMDKSDDSFKMIDAYCLPLGISAKKLNAFVRSCSDSINEVFKDESIKLKCDNFSSNQIAHIVRPIRECSQSTYASSAQSLGICNTNRQIGWYTCREQFAGVFKSDTKNIFFCTTNTASLRGKKDYIGARNRARRVARFIRRIEELMKQKDHSLFYETNMFNVMEVEPSEFWRDCEINRQLFTILIRAGLLYDFNTDNYEDALKGYGYSKSTLPAIMRFIKGYTKFVGTDLNGWVNTFTNSKNKNVEEVLVKPKGINKSKTVNK